MIMLTCLLQCATELIGTPTNTMPMKFRRIYYYSVKTNKRVKRLGTHQY